jgi:hypothetical protein
VNPGTFHFHRSIVHEDVLYFRQTAGQR